MQCRRQVSKTFPFLIPSCTICHFSSGVRSTRGLLPFWRPLFYLSRLYSLEGRIRKCPALRWRLLEVKQRFLDPIRKESGCESLGKGENRRGKNVSNDSQE
jgi:hypothetical protein